MNKLGIEAALQGGVNASEATPEGARQRLLRAFLRELPGQLQLAAERWEQSLSGDAASRDAMRSQMHRLKGEATMLGLAGHAHLLAALRESVTGLPAGEPVPERVAVAVRMAIRAVANLEGKGLTHAEQEAAQLRWLTQDANAIASGVFPRRPR